MLLPKWDFNANKEVLLKMADDKSTSPKDIEYFFNQFFTHVRPLLPITPIKFNFLLRCSKNDDGIENPKSDRIVFNNIKQCSYPPDEHKDKISLQRCNYKGQQVFYASAPEIIIPTTEKDSTLMAYTALCETVWDDMCNTEINRGYATFSKWKVQRELWILALPFSQEACNKNPGLAKAREIFENKLKDICLGNDIKFTFFRDFHEFLSCLFHSNDNKDSSYKITSAFFNTLITFPMERHPNFKKNGEPKNCSVDGLLYPSASTGALGNNICLKKELLDNKIVTGEEVEMYSFRKYPNSLKESNIISASNRVVPDVNGNFKFAYII
jgi:hypothetical protein